MSPLTGLFVAVCHVCATNGRMNCALEKRTILLILYANYVWSKVTLVQNYFAAPTRTRIQNQLLQNLTAVNDVVRCNFIFFMMFMLC